MVHRKVTGQFSAPELRRATRDKGRFLPIGGPLAAWMRSGEAPNRQEGHTVRVLIADDDTAIRDTLSLLLRDERYEVWEAINGLDALQLMRKATEPLIVLLDMWMPGMGGEATLLATLAIEGWQTHYAFLVMTANPQHISDHALAILDRYGIPLLLKPFDIDHVSQVVSRLASRLADDVAS